NGKRWNTGCAFVDYDRDGRLDLFIANYIEMDLATAPVPESGPCLYKGVMVACGPPGLNGGKNILYHNNGDGTFTDVSESAGIFSANGTYGLGVLTADLDNDGWPDILICNGHVYPEVEQLTTEAGYAQRKLLYRNLRNGRFEDVSMQAGPGISDPIAARGCAFGDFDNDGDLDMVVNPINDYPQILRCDSRTGNNWIKVRTIGTKSNRSGIGARLKCVTRVPGEAKPHQQ